MKLELNASDLVEPGERPTFYTMFTPSPYGIGDLVCFVDEVLPGYTPDVLERYVAEHGKGPHRVADVKPMKHPAESDQIITVAGSGWSHRWFRKATAKEIGHE